MRTQDESHAQTRVLSPIGRSILRYLAVISVVVTALVFTTLAAAQATIPSSWVAKAMCIHRHESVDWHRTTDWRGYPSPDRGGLQIALGTWDSFAPASYPSRPESASPHQQLVVAYRIWLANGHRFGGNQWYYSAAKCGVA